MSEISVVVPLYNGERFITEALDSLGRQSLAVAEVIVVDDGSTDDGAAVAESHSLQPLVLRQANVGVAVARNRGALRAKSRFVAFLDQDDLWMPQRHAWLDRFLAATPGCQALVTTERSFYLADSERLSAMGEMLHRGDAFPG